LWYGYQFLSQDLRVRMADIERQNADLQVTLAATQRARDSLAVDLEDAKARLRFTETRYERDVPTGAARRLLHLVEIALNEGATPDRLAFLIAAGARPPQCDDTPVTSTLLVAHPGRTRPNRTVMAADGRLTLTAEGSTATDARGRPEDWFDPEAPVRVHIAQQGLDPEIIQGRLPLSHTALVKGDEYRVTVSEARRGYVQVDVLHCAFP